MHGSEPQNHISLTGDGLHLDGSILWFDAHKKGELSFLSSANITDDMSDSKVISTLETVKILEAQRRKPRALVCQYNQPFAIGRLTMELLPSGSSLGGASLHVETGEKKSSILYAPNVLLQKNSTVRKAQLKRASTLIIKVHHPDPRTQMPSRRKEMDRLIHHTKEFVSKGLFPTILCKSMPTAQEVTKVLSEAKIPLMVHTSIFRINRIYESFGSPLGTYSLYRSKKPKPRVLILPLNRRATILPSNPVFFIEDMMVETNPSEFFTKVNQRFYIGSAADGKDLHEIIEKVGPKEIFFYGPYTKRYVESFQQSNSSLKVFPLYPNNQTPLF